MSSRYELIKDIVADIISEADESKERLKKDRNQHEEGYLLGINECLSIMKTYFIGEEDLEQLLDFDIDERYL